MRKLTDDQYNYILMLLEGYLLLNQSTNMSIATSPSIIITTTVNELCTKFGKMLFSGEYDGYDAAILNNMKHCNVIKNMLKTRGYEIDEDTEGIS